MDMDVLAISEANASGTENDALRRDTGEGSVPAAAENKFQKAIAAWRSKFFLTGAAVQSH
jgi:hypothetical protein